MEWLNSLFSYLSKIFPRITYIPSYSTGVLFSGWTNKVYEKSGIVIWWPIISYLCSYPNVRQARELRHQSLMSLDYCPINILVVVEYSIVDPIQCATSAFDYKEILDNSSRRIIKYEIMSRELDILIDEIEEIDKITFSAIQSEMISYGVDIHDAYISDISLNFPVKIWSEQSNQYESYVEH